MPLLSQITNLLLSSSASYAESYNACAALRKLFSDATGFNENSPENNEHIVTDKGLAVAPISAAFCITDFLRTKVFLQGIHAAIQFKLEQNPGRPVVVLYAGTGPFATLLTPLTTVFSPAQLQMVLLEINPYSFTLLQKTIIAFGLQEYILSAVNADAVHYTISEKMQPDILLSETMKPALQKEPQVSIVAALLKQCILNPLLLPESITIEVVLLDWNNGNGYKILSLKTIAMFNINTVDNLLKKPVEEITIPENTNEGFTRLALLTHITIFGNYALKFNESSLTVPQILMKRQAGTKWPEKINLQYHHAPKPGWVMLNE